ncbi:MAG: His/Gly/Thr/Pro-type tRNA ligase C-terminal domain-containing protein, partial [Patescibacteria group bacterium]
DLTYIDIDGARKYPFMGCYGIGVSRTMGVLVEKFHDERGIMWPREVAPFQVHFVNLRVGGDTIYKKLVEAGVDVLWDDTDRSAGQKLADADLIGIPVRLVVSEKTGEKVEWKERTGDKTELLSLEEVTNRLK